MIKNSDSGVSFEIVDYKDEYKEAFGALNSAWIRRYFKLEPVDIEVFSDPRKFIIERGGFIFCAICRGEVVGVCALLKIGTPEYDYELSKLAVKPDFKGRGVGLALCRAAVEKAKSLSRKKVYLESNTKLVPAISLYRKLGFSEVSGKSASFDRVDIQMEL